MLKFFRYIRISLLMQSREERLEKILLHIYFLIEFSPRTKILLNKTLPNNNDTNKDT